ncbi:MAG: flavodoxin-dependent (E)-4-hydroxy-3-methylbut-2-enyl-diphosphate synthase [Kiritimatiellae bacterium]|nr:flavodoxin-dependent (E)-4-hydroxy-3-methylbut-2-enyl-diphosphate synthase [Kiritimatiellia bacterium]
MYKRKNTHVVNVGSVAVGGDSRISVQTMTKTDTRDVDATVAQIHEVHTLGCDIVRLAVVDETATIALTEIIKQVKIPVIADIHFDHKLAVMALAAGVDGLRINPGNIGGIDKVHEVVSAARERLVPIRIGVNGGSLEVDIAKKYGGSTPAGLVESAMRHIHILEDLDYNEIKVSVKASDPLRTITAYRLLSDEIDYPLHLGVTEAGTFVAGTIRSSVALGVLLYEGIGDTIRISLTDSPANEIKVGLELLRSLELREPGASVISCPTCGRVAVDVALIATCLEGKLEDYYNRNPEAPRPIIAVMGCMVNGPGEAAEADLALAGGDGKFALYLRGKYEATVSEADAVAEVLKRVETWTK